MAKAELEDKMSHWSRSLQDFGSETEGEETDVEDDVSVVSIEEASTLPKVLRPAEEIADETEDQMPPCDPDNETKISTKAGTKTKVDEPSADTTKTVTKTKVDKPAKIGYKTKTAEATGTATMTITQTKVVKSTEQKSKTEPTKTKVETKTAKIPEKIREDNISYRDEAGYRYPLKLNLREDKVKDMEKVIEKATGRIPEEQRTTFQSQYMQRTDHRTLYDMGLRNGSQIHGVARMRGG